MYSNQISSRQFDAGGDSIDAQAILEEDSSSSSEEEKDSVAHIMSSVAAKKFGRKWQRSVDKPEEKQDQEPVEPLQKPSG